MAQQDKEAPAGPAQFARGIDTVELRGDCPREIVDVLDAVSMARNKTRTQLVNEILGAWAEKALHEAMLVCRVRPVNPQRAESSGVSHGQ